jgi:hypothetical protein
MMVWRAGLSGFEMFSSGKTSLNRLGWRVSDSVFSAVLLAHQILPIFFDQPEFLAQL